MLILFLSVAFLNACDPSSHGCKCDPSCNCEEGYELSHFLQCKPKLYDSTFIAEPFCSLDPYCKKSGFWGGFCVEGRSYTLSTFLIPFCKS